MTYHREQELLAMGDASTRKDEERCDRRVTTSPTKASLCDCGACIPQRESNPASLSVTSVNTDAQIAPRNDVVTPEDAQEGGDHIEYIGTEESEKLLNNMLAYTREELVEIAKQAAMYAEINMFQRGAIDLRLLEAQSGATIDALIACGALKVRGE